MTTYNVTARTIRMLPPAGPLARMLLPRGVVVDGTSVAYLDVNAADAAQLGANGWLRLSESGPTAARPQMGPTADSPGYNVQLGAGERFYDTTLSRMVYWNPAKKAWVDETNTAR